MSCKSSIYAVNTTAGTTLANGAVYAPTSVVRRYGQAVKLANNGIVLNEVGYYNVEAVASVTAGAVGVVTAALYKNGVAIPGATASATASAIGDVVSLPITALCRVVCCADTGATITVVISGQATTSVNLAVVVDKE